jgi:hypothetical protein
LGVKTMITHGQGLSRKIKSQTATLLADNRSENRPRSAADRL